MPATTKLNLSQFLKKDDAYATTMVTILIDEFSTEALTWTPKTIIMELESMFGVIPKQGNIDRLMAGVHLMTTNSFYTSLPDFNDLCNVLSGDHPSPDVWQPTDAASCAWAITEAMLIAPPEDTDSAFTDDIRAYMGILLQKEGILNPPDVLRIAHYDKKADGKVRYDYEDDPEMFSAIYKTEQSKTEEINGFIKRKLKDLATQLLHIPLKSGSTEKIVELMLNSLPEDEPPPM